MSGSIFTKYTKYTVKELESYVADPNACVQKLEWTDLVSVLPKYLGNIREGIRLCLSQKIGTYDRKIDGVILAFKNTKVLSPLSAMRPNSVRVHLKARVDFYVFRPLNGAIIEGTVKYVSSNYISAVIYRVFNVTIKLQKQKIPLIAKGSDICVVIKSFDMKSDLPYIEGELVMNKDTENPQPNGNIKQEYSCKDKSSRVKIEKKSESSDTSNPPEHDAGTNAGESDHKVRKSKKIPKRKIKKEPASNKIELNGLHADSEVGSDDEMEQSINALLSSYAQEMDNDVTDSADIAPNKEESRQISPKSSKRKTLDIDAITLDIDVMREKLLEKFSAHSTKAESSKSTAVLSCDKRNDELVTPKKEKKKKRKKLKSNDDDFEASIMSSILKCAAEAEQESAIQSKQDSKVRRKSVRFDDTIMEASFNTFDVSDALEISQLRTPLLSSTLKDSKRQ